MYGFEPSIGHDASNPFDISRIEESVNEENAVKGGVHVKEEALDDISDASTNPDAPGFDAGRENTCANRSFTAERSVPCRLRDFANPLECTSPSAF
jgi:hypothetical protein